MNLGQLCKDFIDANDDAKRWGGTPDEFSEAPDCDLMSQAFVDYLWQFGVPAKLVHLDTSSPIDTAMGYHCVVEVLGLYVDWTARQFHNVGTQSGIYRLDHSEIPCPLIWVGGGPYPLPDIIIEEKEPSWL